MEERINTIRGKIRRRLKTRKILKFVIPLIVLLTVLVVSAIKYDKVYIGTVVSDVNIGGLTIKEAKTKLLKETKGSDPVITLVSSAATTEIRFSNYGEYNITKTAEAAYNKGRENLFKKFVSFLTPFINKNIPYSYDINETMLKAQVSEFQLSLENPYMEDSYEINENVLTIYTGHGGTTLDFEATYKKLTDAFGKNKSSTIDAVTEVTPYKGVDIDKIYKEVFRKVQNASYNPETKELTAHKDGYDFNKEKARQLLLNAKENSVYEIELTVTKPETTAEMLSATIFDTVIASYSTNYNANELNRSANIRLAASKINGIILQPGEIFSYNQTVGNRTASAGFKVAHVYVGNTVTDGIGGGICQVSSTLYNAVLYANLGITERLNHSIPVSYVPLGQDATVAWPNIDFKFKNTLDYPVKVEATASGGVCTVKIMGHKKNDYSVSIINSVSKINSFKTVYTEDTSIKPGTEKVIQKGADGSVIKTKRQIIKDGKIIKTENLPTSNYLATEQKILRNTIPPEEAIEPETSDAPIDEQTQPEVQDEEIQAEE